MGRCRVCGAGWFDEPLARFQNMPRAAQDFPAAQTLETDAGTDLAIWQCSGCGLVQLDCAPVPYYREVIRAAAVSKAVRDYKVAQFTEFVRRFGLRGKRVVEFGCGRGEFLSLLAPLGVEAFGVEYSSAAVAHCVEAGLKVVRGYLEPGAAPPAGAPFGAFLLLMFLEHMPDPNGSLRALHGALEDGAVGLIEVPNFDMVVRRRLFSEFINDHLLYFTRQTLETTLAFNGFELLECDEVRDEYVLSALVRRRRVADLSQFRAQEAKIVAALGDHLGQREGKKVAVWGAGHQALAVMALANLAGRIKYVVDSAPFKQGKYTAATHVPIVAPEALRRDPVDSVIVMAASYSDEVAGILRADFDKRLEVHILRDDGLEKVP